MAVLKKYPFPYKAALAINNDTDGMTWETFRDWHDYVNGKGETQYGPGLGLEISDSFWFWSNNARFALYHNGPNDPALRAPEYEYIAAMARQGWLDMLHGFGSWNVAYKLSRDEMRAALDEMGELGIRPKLYVNHGGGAHMTHNIGGFWAAYQEGDDPSSDSYCLDLLLEHGFRYFWTDVMFESDKFGNGSTWPDTKSRDAALKAYNIKRFTNARTGNRERNLEIILPAFGLDNEAQLRDLVFDNVFLPVEMRDGNRVLGIKRYRGEYPPDAGSFAHQVSAARLDDLVSREAAVVVYQHFGIWRALSSASKDWRAWRPSRIPVLDEHCMWAFRFLAERQERGEIFITTTQRLLDYLRTRDNLRFRVVREAGAVRIHLDQVQCPVYGTEKVTSENAQGLTFSIEGNPEKVTIVDSDNRELPHERHREATTDIVTVPWVRLSYPH